MQGRSYCVALAVSMVFMPAMASVADETWRRHTIDDSSRGADGVRLADANGDGRLDIATGWEEGGQIRVYLQPAAAQVRERWPAVTVGQIASPEDAVLVDLDGDGALDVVSACEGRARTIGFHWAPPPGADYLAADGWRTSELPAAHGRTMWMFALPLDVDGRHGIDLIVGSKNPGGMIGWLESPANPRDVASWKLHELCPAGWIMSLVGHDVDADGDLDVVASDRRGPDRAVIWLENPGSSANAEGAQWQRHVMGAAGDEVMFLALADLDSDGLADVVASTRNGLLRFLRRTNSGSEPQWESCTIDNPLGVAYGKSVAVVDVDLDDRLDLIHATNTQEYKSDADRPPAVTWMSYRNSVFERQWDAHDISGPAGVKFDLVAPLDLDNDGDADIITCEERANLGVFWYENPTR